MHSPNNAITKGWPYAQCKEGKGTPGKVLNHNEITRIAKT
jgi:hypothetical protein